MSRNLFQYKEEDLRSKTLHAGAFLREVVVSPVLLKYCCKRIFNIERFNFKCAEFLLSLIFLWLIEVEFWSYWPHLENNALEINYSLFSMFYKSIQVTFSF